MAMVNETKTDSPQARDPTASLNDLMRTTRRLRNVAIVGDRGHGKTSLVRALANRFNLSMVASEASATAEKTLATTHVVFTSFTDESLCSHLIHIVDTPGSLDFEMDIDAALALVDGVVVVVDPYDGVGLLAEKTIEKAVTHRKTIVMFLNKLDKEPGYDACVAAVEAANSIIERACADQLLVYRDYELDPTLGNVVFGSTLTGRGFTLARLAASTENTTTIQDQEDDQRESGERTREQLFDQAIARAFPNGDENEVSSENSEDDDSWIHIPSHSSLAKSVLSAIVRHVPSPVESPLQKVPSDRVDREWEAAIRDCDSNGPLVVHVVKLLSTNSSTSDLVAIGRVLSGTVSTNQDVSVVMRSICDDTTMERRIPIDPATIQHHTTRITAVSLASTDPQFTQGLEIPAGNLCVLGGVDAQMYKPGVVMTSDPNAVIASRFFRCIVGHAKPRSVARVTIAPPQPNDLRKLWSAMQSALRTDLASECYLQEGGEIMLTAVTPSHLQYCLLCIRDHVPDEIPYRVSDPFVFYQETITTRSSRQLLARAPNNHIRLFCTAEPLDDPLLREWTSPGIANQSMETLQTRLLQVHGWRERDAARIVADPLRNCGPNVLVDQSLPLFHSFMLEEPMRRGLIFAASAGVLCDEPMVGMRINLEDTAMFGMERHWRPAQGLVAMRKATFACLLASSPALLEPVFAVEIRWHGHKINTACLVTVVTNRRGRMARLDKARTTLRVLVPVRESFDLEDALRAVVGGDAKAVSLQVVLDHYERIEGDPLDPTSLAGAAVRELRVRKHLDPDVPPLDRFHHQR